MNSEVRTDGSSSEGKRHFNCILLVDDDEAATFIHKLLLKKLEKTRHIASASNGEEALAYLQSALEGECPTPDAILLDINMPVMDGWEFLETYSNWCEKLGASPIPVYMLTSSPNPDDIERSKSIKEVIGFHRKPLSKEVLEMLSVGSDGH